MFGVRDGWQRDYRLRENVEAACSAYCSGGAIASVTAAAIGVATPTLSAVSASIMTGLALKYGKEAIDHFSYKNGLWQNVPFIIDTNEMPGTEKLLYLGRGFQWTKEHTQRLYDINDYKSKSKSGRGTAANDDRFKEVPKVYKTARQLQKWAERIRLKPIVAAFRENWALNPYPEQITDTEDDNHPGGLPYLHAVGGRDYDFYTPFAGLNAHTLVLGTTRVGKTRSAEVMITQDISKHKDCSVIAIDPKGDLELALRMYMEAKRAGKAKKFYFFSLAHPHLSVRYNGVSEFNRITEVATRITKPLPDGGNSKIFKDFAWLFINTCQKAVFKMGKVASYINVQQYLTDAELLASDYVESLRNDELNTTISAIAEAIDPNKLAPADKTKSMRTLAIRSLIQEPPEEFRELVANDSVLRSVAKVLQYDRAYYDKITASAMPHLEKLTTGKVANVISPDYEDLKDNRPIMDLRKVIREGGIVYIGLDSQTDNVTSSAVGNSFLSEILSVSGEIYNYGVDQGIVTLHGQRRKKGLVRLHVDEANEVFGDEFNPILNKSGGSGVMVTAYTQNLSDVEVRLGDAGKAKQALGNFGTIVVFRVRGEDTPKYFVNQMPEVRICTVQPDSKVTDGLGDRADGQFKSSNGDTVSYERVPLIPANAFLELPKGQAFVYSGSKWFKVKMPLFKKETDMPENIEAMMRDLESELGYRVTNDLDRAA
ncbi:conjugative transfer system coupling protein TraD [Vibrio harveyi]|uniref:conjugative transfer system coupling protein TraD n=1 Tax=Vibrio harveyi TaxID=669 RepID=UPI001EFD1D4D|nr:conjugative transfer system coupling protein TraD [Vibrio harveyi]MCG9589963.1 conjugative transfer system coupling protein TraD [Vibrio harveyi]WJT11014.1 conjugative transfer system coupling protein TraD [Vibrio harveyi]